MTLNLVDVRCDGIRPRGVTAGQVCNYLLLRVEPDMTGGMETKCPKCYKVQRWSLPRALNRIGSIA